ncbi:aldehyde dehydrogenase family protein [Paenibacillus sp. 23TSA30-6]|uniref:aldehyde dehydrogenase family protein n=1 Tax=Paenibacillus sp. 23TSA30-6 TaxID=2546104 RepID=UPI0017888299|nr:aldehyde dehydrogenase family protein [Paenibacillus sp. 23TSA30-6]MBE0339403.1 aldehyde dehydrogenase family protein [Paenibacillus sp. 23TSA30-6]
MESRNWIGGEWLSPSGEEMVVRNPSALKEEVGIVHFSDTGAITQAGEAARLAQAGWSALSPAARGAYLFKAAGVLEASLPELAELASREMGKPITEMRGEVMRGVHLLRYYAAEGVRSIGTVIPSNEPGVLQYTKRIPLGVTAVITPWNFPVAIPLWKIAPALLCGNTVIWKPAEHASLTAVRVAELFEAVQLPPGVLNLVVGQGSRIGDALLEHPALDAVSFTGSTPTGLGIAERCARRNIKYQTEMGGKNAAIVLKDADIAQAVAMIASGAFRSAGQKCTATSRVIVERSVYETFTDALRQAVGKIQIAPALDPGAYLGPVASAGQYEKVMSYVALARREADILAEGGAAAGTDNGYYVRPLVAAGLDSSHPLIQEEIFGPLIGVVQADDFEDAIRLCNDSIYGLSASLFTRDLRLAHRFLDEADAGMVRVNQETAGVEYQAPFGGLKRSSSHTREQGQAALDFYSAIKTCAISYE